MAKSEGKVEFLMKFNHSGHHEPYLAAIRNATTATQNCNAMANCEAPRDRYDHY